MQSVSDDDIRKRLLERPRFELVAKGVFRLGRCHILQQGATKPQHYPNKNNNKKMSRDMGSVVDPKSMMITGYYHMNSFCFFQFVLPSLFHLVHQFLRLLQSLPEVIRLHALLTQDTNKLNINSSYILTLHIPCALPYTLVPSTFFSLHYPKLMTLTMHRTNRLSG